LIAANPRVSENTGRVAVQRGPVVFCLEETDQPNGVAMADMSVVIGSKAKDFKNEFNAGLLDGVMVLHHEGAVSDMPSGEKALYLSAGGAAAKTRPTELTMIPYYAWANRKPTPMQVWAPFTRI
jgi:hypothetical protein